MKVTSSWTRPPRAYPTQNSPFKATYASPQDRTMNLRITMKDEPTLLVLPAFLLASLFAIVVIVALSSSPQDTAVLTKAYHRHRRTFSRSLSWRSRVPRLPIEVMESIIDQLYDDKRTLAACKLTQRAWIARSRLHLHRDLKLVKGGRLDPYQLRFFPAVAQCIRSVVVSHTILKEVKASVLIEIDKVESLAVVNTEPEQSSTILIRAADFPHFTKLKVLDLQCGRLRSSSDLLSVLAMYRHISVLSVHMTKQQSGTTSQRYQIALAHCPRLELEKLDLNVADGVVQFPEILLGRTGPRLRDFGFCMMPLIPLSLTETFRALNRLNLLPFTSMETIRLRFLWMPTLWLTSQARINEHLRQATTFFSQIHSTRLHTITFRVIVFVVDPQHLLEQLRHFHLRWLDNFAQPLLDDVYDRANAARIQQMADRLERLNVDVLFSCRLSKNDVARIHAHALTQLPVSDARGILHLTMAGLPERLLDLIAGP